MTKKITNYLLRRNVGSAPVFSSEKTSLHPSRFFESIDASEVLLGSGFTAITGDSSFPLSAALQLNGDLSGLSQKQLKQSAEAELERRNQTSYRSYTIDADNRICILADNSELLNTFLDNYGGILEIEALLLKGNHPEFSGVTELNISSVSSGYQIEYAIRSPVDKSICTYCGACGPACPEACITESLFLDFDTCTFCKECEKICPVNAIDVSAVERQMLEIPAILILGETIVELPDNTKNIYREEDLTIFLSTLFPCKIDEVITCDRHICQYSLRSKSGCTACLDVCRHGAVSVDENGITIDALKCVECGHCVGICPTGSIQYQRFTDRAFIEFFRSFPLQQGTTIVLGTESVLHNFWWKQQGNHFEKYFFLEYPNNQAISFLHLSFLLAHGAEHVIILHGEETVNVLLKKTVTEINKLIDKLFDSEQRVTLASVSSFSANALPQREKPLTTKIYTDLSYINRRRKIASVLNFFTEQSSKELEFTSGDIRNFGTILCDNNSCTQCFACLNECNIESLSADSSAMSLLWTGSLCINCGACVAICPENALMQGETINLLPGYFAPVKLARAEPISCKECGKVFGTQKSFDRVMKILTDRKMDHDGHFEYCEDCRVIKLFDSE